MIKHPKLVNFLPEELRQTPFAVALAESYQELVADKAITHANQFLRIYDASHDRKAVTINLISLSQQVQFEDDFKPGTLTIAVAGSDLLKESEATLTNETTGSLVSTITGEEFGTLDKLNKRITFKNLLPSSSAPITMEVQYDTLYELDFDALTDLRKSMGLFIDATGFQSEDVLRRAVLDLPHFYEVCHSLKFVDYLSFVSNVRFKLSELYARVNAYPNYGTLVELEKMQNLGFTQWAHEAALPANIDDINPATVGDTIWYKTSLVIMQYDDEMFFKDVGLDVNLFEKITKLFYQLAPIHLVLLTIQARRLREHTMKWRCAIRRTHHVFATSNP